METIYNLVEAFISNIEAQAKEFGLFFDPDEDIQRQLYCNDELCRLAITLDDATDFLCIFRFIAKYASENNYCIIDSLNYKNYVITVDIMTRDALVNIFYK